MCPVTINVIPLEHVTPFDVNEELFIFLRESQSSLQGSLILDAIFLEFWPQ